MSVGVAIVGWALVTALALYAAVLRRRLELVACASHELRGPVSALGLAVTALARDARAQAVARPLEAQLDRLRVGFADLEAARVGRRATQLPSEVSLEALARRAVAGWRPSVTAAGRRLVLRWDGDPVTVRIDRGRFVQALGNLVDNAVEHGRGPVELRGRRVGSRVVLEVCDDGASAASTGQRSRADRGRGLSIASRAVTDAGGALRIERGPEGTRAAIELPVVQR